MGSIDDQVNRQAATIQSVPRGPLPTSELKPDECPGDDGQGKSQMN